jgi:hypothetical protein
MIWDAPLASLRQSGMTQGGGGGRGWLRFRSFTPGIRRSFRMTIGGAAIVRRAALLNRRDRRHRTSSPGSGKATVYR